MGDRPADEILRGAIMNRPLRILRLDTSANPGESTSRELGDELLTRLAEQTKIEVRQRDLNQDLSFIDSSWIGANFTAAQERSDEQVERLQFSDRLIKELQWADRILLTTPMYNFGVPATLKAWIDHVCRVGITFRYTENGPQGLLANRPVDIVVTSGGVPLGSPVDFVSGYLRQVFAFIGIDDVNIIGAAQMNVDADASLSAARAQIERIEVLGERREVA
jgi:FMN-dependent NADH-azoreductase